MSFPIEGGCDCKQLRYRMQTKPLIVHCCHCRWCQRETGASFVLNAMIESDRVTLLAAKPDLIDTPSQIGMGQQIARCPKCRIALWSHYAGAGPLLSFVRVGTLDEPDHLPPDIHIFTASSLLTSSFFNVHISQPYNNVIQINFFLTATLNRLVENSFLLLNISLTYDAILDCLTRHLFNRSLLNLKPTFSHLNSFTHSY